jgi:glycogen synthase
MPLGAAPSLSRKRHMNFRMNPIALVAYESRFARCGGVTAVLNYLPGSLAKATAAETCVITPYHHQIPATVKLATEVIGSVQVPFAGQDVRVLVHRWSEPVGAATLGLGAATVRERCPWYFVDAQDFIVPVPLRQSADDTRFFAGRRHPYDVGRESGDQLAILRRDALFFGAAVARALDVIGPPAGLTLLLQDWQAATTALALAGLPRSVRCALTLHNSYDSGGVWPEELQRFGIDPAALPGADGSDAATVLNRALPRVSKPIFTVSQQFALDFSEDVFQREVMANQLQHALRPPNIVGVNNGPFANLAIPEAARAAAQRRDYGPLQKWKRAQKTHAIEALRGFTPTADRPAWGDLAKFIGKAASRDGPWFVMAGRDDSRQKGYDVAARALHKLFADQGLPEAGQYLFFPIPGDEDRAGLTFLRDLAQTHPDNVLVLPFIFVEGYLAALQGAEFGVMPSLYEPFGMANEFYLNGAVGIGRATGGLTQQIVPLRSAASFTAAVAGRADRWHDPEARATGFLFREPDDLPEVVADWRSLNAVGYKVGGHPDRVEERSRYRLFNAMAEALEQALADALELYGRSREHDDYYALVTAGVEYIQKTFSWDKAATEYARMIGERGA